VAEHRHPQGGDPGAGTLEGGPSATPGQRVGGEAELVSDARDHGGERHAGRPRRRGRVHRALERGHELGTPEHPRIALGGLPASAEGLDRGPAARTAEEPAALEVGPPALGDPRGDEAVVGVPGSASGGPALGQDGLGGLPGAGDGPQKRTVAGPGVARSRVARSGTTCARSGFRWR
jgi:hypothetical protein